MLINKKYMNEDGNVVIIFEISDTQDSCNNKVIMYKWGYYGVSFSGNYKSITEFVKLQKLKPYNELAKMKLYNSELARLKEQYGIK